MTGKQIRIFLVEGMPTGLRTADVGMSTCKAVMAPRVRLESLAGRPEARRPGVYVLIGEDERYPGRKAIYIGEADDVFARIHQHDDEGNDFWEHVVLFSSKDENLTKAHVRYLEARLITMALGARRATVTNNTAPDYKKLPLPEPDGVWITA